MWSTAVRPAATDTSIANNSKWTRSGGSPAYISLIAGPALRVWPQGESRLWCGHSDCVSSEWCAGCPAKIGCETSSEWSPNAAAIASQHGNSAELNQNATQASTKITRPNPCGSRGRLASDTAVILRLDENVFINWHRCQQLLTAMRMTTFARKTLRVCTFPYIALHQCCMAS